MLKKRNNSEKLTEIQKRKAYQSGKLKYLHSVHTHTPADNFLVQSKNPRALQGYRSRKKKAMQSPYLHLLAALMNSQ